MVIEPHACKDGTIANPLYKHELQKCSKEFQEEFAKFIKREKELHAVAINEHKGNNHYENLTKFQVLTDIILDEKIDIRMLLDSVNRSTAGKLYEALWEIVIILGFLPEYNTGFMFNDAKRPQYQLFPYKIETNDSNNIQDFVIENKNVVKHLLKEKVATGNIRGVSDITLVEIKPTKIPVKKSQWVCEYQYNPKTDNAVNIVTFSCKYYAVEKSVKEYDIAKLHNILSDKYNESQYKIVLLVKNKKRFLEKLFMSHNDKRTTYGQKLNAIFDYDDIHEIISHMRANASAIQQKIDDITRGKKADKENKPVLEPKFHQLLFVNKTIDAICTRTIDGYSFIDVPKPQMLWGQIPRSGKTYTAGCLISKLYKGGFFRKDNIQHRNIVLVITPAPSETIEQFVKDMFEKYNDFNGFEIKQYHIIYKDLNNTIQPSVFKYDKDKLYIFVVSKQFLQGAKNENDERILLNTLETKCRFLINKVSIVIFDEIHYGGSTIISNKILDTIDPQSAMIRIMLTATYKKPVQYYNIQDSQLLTWGIEDIQTCKTITSALSIETLYKKYGTAYVEATLQEISLMQNQGRADILYSIEKDYERYPSIHVITTLFSQDKINTIKSGMLNSRSFNGENNVYGFDMNSLFELIEIDGKKNFINEISIRNLLKYIASDIFERMTTVMKRYNQHNQFTSQLWFLPYFKSNHIKDIAPLFEQYINNDDDYKDYNVITMLGDSNKNTVKEAEHKAYKNNKRGLIILAGKKLSLGVSLPCTDVVMFLNNDSEVDVIYQRMFRSLTERNGKRVGFIVDMNPYRTIDATLEYITPHHRDKSNTERDKQIIKKLVENRTIYIDEDVFLMRHNKSYEDLYKKIGAVLEQSKYTRVTKALETDLYDIFSETMLDSGFIKIIRQKLSSKCTKPVKTKMKIQIVDKNDDEIQMPDGRFVANEASQTNDDSSNNNKDDEKDYTIAHNLTYALQDFVFLTAILTDDEYCDTKFTDLMDVVMKQNFNCSDIDTKTDNNTYLTVFNILCRKLSPYANPCNITDVTKAVLAQISHVKEHTTRINKMYCDIKEILTMTRDDNDLKNRGDMTVSGNHINSLHAFVEKYLPPKEHEKKAFGEVFTPLWLVRQMLNKIDEYDKHFWKNPDLKILDPAAGIGNFPLIAYEKLMDGLKDVAGFRDEEKRRRHILENMLYMIELNPVNVKLMKRIFKNKLSKNKQEQTKTYKLNIIQGDALNEVNQTKLFVMAGTDKFDLIMGNPPFQKTADNGGKKTKSLWDDFVVLSLQLLKENCYLTLIHPSGWRDIDGKYKYIQEEYLRRELLYLEIHDVKDGVNTFNSNTRYDWFLLRNKSIPNTSVTKVRFQDEHRIKEVNLHELPFIPNGKYDIIKSLIAKNSKEVVEVLYDSASFHHTNRWMSPSRDKQHTYPCIYSIDKNDEPSLYWSSKNTSPIFDKPKFIWTHGSGTLIDNGGKYGLTEFAYAIIDKQQNLQKIKYIFDSQKFRDLMKYCTYKQNAINRRIIATFKKDFWKDPYFGKMHSKS